MIPFVDAVLFKERAKKVMNALGLSAYSNSSDYVFEELNPTEYMIFWKTGTYHNTIALVAHRTLTLPQPIIGFVSISGHHEYDSHVNIYIDGNHIARFFNAGDHHKFYFGRLETIDIEIRTTPEAYREYLVSIFPLELA
jgi:hypothetical protein